MRTVGRLELDAVRRRIVRQALKQAWSSSSNQERRIIEQLLDDLKRLHQPRGGQVW